MFNKNERLILNQLSKDLYGSESKWQKILKHPAYQMSMGTYKLKTTVYSKNTKTGQLTVAGAQDVDKHKTRQMTFSEVFGFLVHSLDAKIVHKIRNEQPEFLPRLFAHRLVKKELIYPFRLKTTEEEKDELLKKVNDLPDYIQDAVNYTLTTEKNVQVVGGAPVPDFDAVEFIDLLFGCVNETSEENKKIDSEFLTLKAKLLNTPTEQQQG